MRSFINWICRLTESVPFKTQPQLLLQPYLVAGAYALTEIGKDVPLPPCKRQERKEK
jgi:hypothetical protein